ncbi:hypothetical protein [Geotalea sp. SG265]|uniref:hypothetical protein n=1 Tax=Geotalea sp. SG265 TaxID=2922867 RepID=UPI001FB04836|nr:hypothetical protein [Geotalea sp. SG265]
MGNKLNNSKPSSSFRVFATTVKRGEANPEMTGFLLEIDWARNCVIRQIPIPMDTTNPYWNSRGGNRGGRGIVATKTKLFVATATSILVYNQNLDQIGEISHPYLAGLHELFIDHDGIWVTSTVHDLVMKLDFNGAIIDTWWGSESLLLQKYFGFSGRELNLSMSFPEATFEKQYDEYCKDERLHINSVFAQEGSVYVLCNRKNAIIKIRPLPEEIIIVDNELHSPHNLIITSEGIAVVNNTQKQSINIYDLRQYRLLTEIGTGIFDQSESEQFASSGWQRGLAPVKDSIYLVGTSPAAIFEVDISTNKIGQICHIDSDVRHCIHGLAVTTDF